MKRIFVIPLLLITLSVSAFPAARSASAALGGSVASITADHKALAASKQAMAGKPHYTIYSFSSGSTMVREYVSSSGIVFAVAWNGLTHPDLKSLLGSYYGDYKDALQNTSRSPATKRRHSVVTGNITVEKWGHMRNLRGRAYAPALMPSGVTIDEIK